MVEQIHVGDIGTQFIFTMTKGDGTILDVSTASIKNAIFGKPDNTLVTKALDFFTDGTDGKLIYTSQAGDLDQDGEWQSQTFVDLDAGSWHSSINYFVVLPNLST